MSHEECVLAWSHETFQLFLWLHHLTLWVPWPPEIVRRQAFLRGEWRRLPAWCLRRAARPSTKLCMRVVSLVPNSPWSHKQETGCLGLSLYMCLFNRIQNRRKTSTGVWDRVPHFQLFSFPFCCSRSPTCRNKGLRQSSRWWNAQSSSRFVFVLYGECPLNYWLFGRIENTMKQGTADKM